MEDIMIKRVDIPIGKALIPIEIDPTAPGNSDCSSCYFHGSGPCYEKMACRSHDRIDKKNVIYNIVEFKWEEEATTPPKKRYKRKTLAKVG